MRKSKIYVGNLCYDASQEASREALGKIGEIQSISMIIDRETGRHYSPDPCSIVLAIERDSQPRAVPWCAVLGL
ncbi:MAG: hypothetical protein O6948_09750 [Deltaproteobacteria bacterium]|nr:hypothetical protein [Deltaproteobacteria bacterium]